MSVVLWFLQSSAGAAVSPWWRMRLTPFPGAVGGFIAPVLVPLGFGTWQAAVVLLTGLVAKEAVVSP